MKVSIEAVRNYWDVRPCNLHHSEKEVGTKPYFDEVEYRKYLVEPHIPLFADFGAWRGKRVLEIGCGMGTDTINFARNGARVTAVDLSQKSLDLAAQRARIYGVQDYIRFHIANAEELTRYVPVESYDLIYSFGVIHHTPSPTKAMNEILHYMGPDSTLKIMLYHKISWKVLWIWAKFGHFCRFYDISGLVARYSEAQTGCPMTYTYTKKSAKRLLEDFEIDSIRIEHIFPYRVKEYKNHVYKKALIFRFMPCPIFRWLERYFGWHLCVTAKRKVNI